VIYEFLVLHTDSNGQQGKTCTVPLRNIFLKMHHLFPNQKLSTHSYYRWNENQTTDKLFSLSQHWRKKLLNYQRYCFVLASYGTPAEVWYCWFKQMPIIATRLILHSHSLEFAVWQTCHFPISQKINYINTTWSFFTFQIYGIHRSYEIIFTNVILRN
jgi:hypothetical protein